MNLKDITYGLIILIIPLILILVLHRFYVYNICHNNKECIKKKVLLDIDTFNYKLINNINFLKKENTENEIENEEETNVPQEEIEGFFGGISDWVYGKVGGINAAQNIESPVNNLNPSASALQAANSTENSMPNLNSKFPNENINDSSNQDLLDSINKKKRHY